MRAGFAWPGRWMARPPPTFRRQAILQCVIEFRMSRATAIPARRARRRLYRAQQNDTMPGKKRPHALPLKRSRVDGDDALLNGDGDSFRAVAGLQLIEDVIHVIAPRAIALSGMCRGGICRVLPVFVLGREIRRPFEKKNENSYPWVLAQFRSSESLHQSASFRTWQQPRLVAKKRRTLEARIDIVVKPSECGALEAR